MTIGILKSDKDSRVVVEEEISHIYYAMLPRNYYPSDSQPATQPNDGTINYT